MSTILICHRDDGVCGPQDRGAWDLVVPLLTPEDKDRIESFEVFPLFVNNGQLEREKFAMVC